MTGQLRSELLKLRTTRTAVLLLAAAAGIALFGVFAEGLPPTAAELAEETRQREQFSGGTIGVFFATLAGLLMVTSEFRYGTIRTTLLFEPRRRVVLAARLVAAALAGVAFAVATVAVSFGGGLALLAARDVDVVLTTPHALALVLGPLCAATLSALLGVAIGTLIRNQVGAIVALAAYALAVDATLFAAAPSVGAYLPGKAGDALAGLPDEQLLVPGIGAAVLLAWTLVVVAGAALRDARSDV